MPSTDLAPQYLTPAQMAQLLAPQTQASSSLSQPVDWQKYQDMIDAQKQNDTVLQGFVEGGPVQFASLEQKYGLPEGLLAAVQAQETGGEENPVAAVSKKGAMGPFQFMPATAKQYGVNPKDPNQAARGAARMLAELHDKFNGSLPHVLAAYNWGRSNVINKGLDNAPPETRNYVQGVMARLDPDSEIENLPKPQRKPTQLEAAHESVEQTLSDYDTPMGREYMAARRNAASNLPDSVSIHDLVSGNIPVKDDNPPKFAGGGLIHKFTKFVPTTMPIAKTHYRDSMGNEDLAKVRSIMKVR